MKLLYIANQRIPTEKAYGRQIAKMCESFADLGIEVELIAPVRKSMLIEDLFSYYSIKRNFKFTKIMSPDWYWPGYLDRLAFGIKNLISARRLARYALGSSYQVIYSRDELPVYFLSSRGKHCIYEAHKFSKLFNVIFRSQFKKIDLKIIAISHGLGNEFIKAGFNQENILIAPDGVDEVKIREQETNPISKEEARNRLGLPLDRKILVYTGSFYKWKGIYILADAAKMLEKEALIVMVGGNNDLDQRRFEDYLKRENIKNIKITGFIKEGKIRDDYRLAADALILPNTSKEKISEVYTSPLKLFSYMALRRPIVASDLPSIREVLNEENAVLVKPDSPRELADGARKVIADQQLALRISNNAFTNAHDYTWQKRAQNILKFML
ncbi:MAG: glycosyltransferase [Patescibacteria group bacterium]